jgi:hypothetical protein
MSVKIFNDENKEINNLFLLDISPDEYDDEFIKENLFVNTEKFKYHPIFTRVYARSPNNREVFVVSVIDIMMREKQGLLDEGFRNGLFNNLRTDFPMVDARVFDSLMRYIFEPKSDETKEFIGGIMASLSEFRQRINMRLGIMPRPPPKSDDWSKTSSKSVEILPAKSIEASVLHYNLTLTKTIESDLDLNGVYADTRINSELLVVGMLVDGVPKYKKANITDRKILKKIDEFIMSEHKTGKEKVLEPFKVYYLQKSGNNYLHGTISTRAVVKVKVKPGDPMDPKDLDESRGALEDAKSILKYIPKYTMEKRVVPYDISIKVVYRDGYFKNEFIKKTMGGKIDRTMVRFDVSDKIKGVIYSGKGNMCNFTFFKLMKSYIPEALKTVRYLINTHSNELKQARNVRGKAKAPLVIPVNARECVKERQPKVISRTGDVPKGVHIIEFRGQLLVCNREYPWPGFTKKSGIPCCFKKRKENQQLEYTDSIQDKNVVSRILGEHFLTRDTNEMDRYRMGLISNPVLTDVFGNKSYYSLSPGKKAGLVDAIKFVYGQGIISKSISGITAKMYEDYRVNPEQGFNEWRGDEGKSEESIVRAVSVYNKINLMVIVDKNPETKITCSMSDYFVSDKYVVFLRNLKTKSVNVLVKVKNKSLDYEMKHSSKKIQKLVRMYNEACHTIAKCDEKVYSLQDIIGKVKVKAQIVNSFNKVYYLETEEYGVIPILPSAIDYTIPSKKFSEVNVLDKYEQYTKLVKASEKMPYLKPVAQMINYGDERVSAIQTYCRLFSPVKDDGKNKSLPKTVKVIQGVFYFDLDYALKEVMVSDNEMRVFMNDLEDNYYGVAKRILKNYYFQEENADKKEKLFKMIKNEKYDDLIAEVGGLFIREKGSITKDKLPVEEVIPLRVNNAVFDDVVSRIVWDLINEGPLFFNKARKKKNRVDIRFIPLSEEVEITQE